MSKAITLAKQLLEAEAYNLKELRVYEFSNDELAHDDELVEKLHGEFLAEFETVQAELISQFALPSRRGTKADAAIPLNGVFYFAIWPVGDRQLFVAVAHEDRGCPILFVLGTQG